MDFENCFLIFLILESNAIFGETILCLEKNIFALKVETILLKKSLCKIEGKLPFSNDSFSCGYGIKIFFIDSSLLQ